MRQSSPSRGERHKELVRDLLAAADAGDMERVLSHYSPDYVDHDSGEARSGEASDFEGVRIAFSRFATAFPDTRHTIHDLIADGDRVVLRVSAEGTHTGSIAGIPPTGRTVRNDSIVIYRFAEGKIVERWCRERLGTLDQLRAPGESVDSGSVWRRDPARPVSHVRPRPEDGAAGGHGSPPVRCPPQTEPRPSGGMGALGSNSCRYYPASALRLHPDVPGARYFAVALERSMLSYFEVAPNSVFAEHRHPSEQITMVLSGELLFRVGGDEILVGPGEVVAVPADVPHAVISLDLPVTAVDAWSPPRPSFACASPASRPDSGGS